MRVDYRLRVRLCGLKPAPTMIFRLFMDPSSTVIRINISHHRLGPWKSLQHEDCSQNLVSMTSLFLIRRLSVHVRNWPVIVALQRIAVALIFQSYKSCWKESPSPSCPATKFILFRDYRAPCGLHRHAWHVSNRQGFWIWAHSAYVFDSVQFYFPEIMFCLC